MEGERGRKERREGYLRGKTMEINRKDEGWKEEREGVKDTWEGK